MYLIDIVYFSINFEGDEGGPFFEGDPFSRGTLFRWGPFFEGDPFSRGTFFRGGPFFEGDPFSRGPFFEGDPFLKGTLLVSNSSL